MFEETSRLHKILGALSRLINVAFLPNHRETSSEESISARAYRMRWRKLESVINAIFFWEADHTRAAHKRRIERARRLLEAHGND